ncbi:MAG TPA: 2,3,4,5-tetrahydropyridine-2,6-dicarboxylate N-succinyltransferase [Exilispira sp.]|nr:2,3,4,5-tetrahydropyridine-2,6-dicarboxylate N-succinyltransferase [Exilispira sp.]
MKYTKKLNDYSDSITKIKEKIEVFLNYEESRVKEEENEKLKNFEKPFSENELIKYLEKVLQFLELGVLKVVNKEKDNYIVNEWVKKAILLYFKYGKLKKWKEKNIDYLDKFEYRGSDGTFRFLPGSILRKGAFVGKGTVVMPPSFINVGAYIDEKSMVDSLALIGSCAQIGKNCHISAGTIIGGVLEPAVARPVIIEDNVFVGGNCGIYEGVLIRKGAIIGTGTIINASTPIIDIRSEKVYSKEVPENAIVIPGGRKKDGKDDYFIQVPLIIKYRDELKDPSKVDLNVILHDF